MKLLRALRHGSVIAQRRSDAIVRQIGPVVGLGEAAMGTPRSPMRQEAYRKQG
jgi:hypothetical protein